MKSILVYGDSLVWGRAANPRGRHPFNYRWPNVLSSQLKDTKVYDAGLGGRTTDLDFPGKPGRNGLSYLQIALLQAVPLDLVVLALGTNDLFANSTRRPQETANGMKKLISIVKELPNASFGSTAEIQAPKVMIISPPMCLPRKEVGGDGFPELDILVNWLRELESIYKILASKEGTYFLESSRYCSPDPADGLHLDAENTRNLGLGVANKLLEAGVFEKV